MFNKPYTVEYKNLEVTLSKKCKISGEPYILNIPTENYEAWKEGEYAQNAFSFLSTEEREFVISGTTPKEWDNMFQDE
jgi:hypothetical protein